MKNVLYLLLSLLINNFGLCINLRNSYTAAVVDYVHEAKSSLSETFAINVHHYINHMRNASRRYADIIVFPEYGLVDIYTMYAAAYDDHDLEDISSFVPDPKHKIVPCEDKGFMFYSPALVNISCAARLHGLYTIFNLPEKANNRATGNLSFYNTDVILDRSGTVIGKHRKIHLSEESFLEPGDELVTFKTDFNVTFGIFTCFDILFQYPALEILNNKEVTDIVFTTAWFSETPFLQALSIQHGYAKKNGVNFLASGLQEPSTQDGGSGVYLADGTIAELFISSKRISKVIVQEVPIIKQKTPANMCEYTIDAVMKKTDQNKNKNYNDNGIDKFNISREVLQNFTFIPLNIEGVKTLRRMCSEDKSFCCTFNVTIEPFTNETVDYFYKMAIYRGLSRYGSNYYGGIRACALMSCSNESDSSCGHKLSTSLNGIIFKSISIEAIVDNENDTYNQPATLKHDLTPLEEYVYCETAINQNKQTKISMKTLGDESKLLTFGIYGRLYSIDTVPTVAPTEPPKTLNITLILIIMSVSSILLIFTGVILYQFCTKKD